ncbi:TIR domain-containing protein [Streptomyces sp. A012304]|uniref:TIR domain-containing protein n=1 Tax=Streptomyces sp. A012304 TaxID=375446 RepID=UPI0022308071|nr:TIR domain-containing protein [Streptomyces sp. A012304]GKQ38937.1 hypothetical protein ALMP_54660 [Streptomyces sp. A012304]
MKPPAAFGGSYDAFLSYSHEADSALAPAVQRGLHRLAKPWNRPRALRVFRDQESLAANPDLWTTIETALRDSRYFILMASRKSARSPWVGRETAFWKRHRGPETMLIVLTDGDIVWDHSRGDFDWARTTALPAHLRGWFQGEPLWVDLRGAVEQRALSLSHSRFREAIGMLAAAVHGVSKDELDSEEVRQHTRTVRLRRAAVTALTVLTVIALVMSNLANERRQEAEDQRRQAEEQRRLATVRALQAEAENLRQSDPLTSLRFSVAALRVKPTAEAREGLVATLHSTHLAGVSASGIGKSDLAAYTTDGTLLATAAPYAGRTAAARRAVALWDVGDVVRPRRLATLTGHAESVQSFAFRADGRLLVTIGNAGRDQHNRSSLILWDLADRARPRKVLHWENLRDAAGAAFSPDGRTMALVSGSANGTLQLWDVSKPSAPRRLTGPLPAVDSDAVMFSPDGRTLVTGSGVITASDGSLEPESLTHTTGWMTWDIRDPRKPRALSRQRPFGNAVFSPVAPVLAVQRGRNVTLWDLRRPEAPRQLAAFDHKEQVQAVAFSPDGRHLAVSLLDDTAFLRDVSDPSRPGKPVLLGGHDTWVEAIGFSRDSRTVSLVDGDGALTRWLVGSRSPARVAALSMDTVGLYASAFSPDGRKLAVAAYDGEVWLWDTSDPARPRRHKSLTGQLQRASAVSFNGDGSVLAVGSQAGESNATGKITLWDTTDLSAPRRLGAISPPSGVSALALNPRRPLLVAVGGKSFEDTWVHLWDVRDPQRPVRTWQMDPYEPYEPFGNLPYMGTSPALFTPDGSTMALPDALWNVTDPSAPAQLPAKGSSEYGSLLEDSFDHIGFRADGRQLVASDTRRLSVWSLDPKTGRKLLSSTEVPDRFSQIDVHPAGHLVVTGNTAGRAELWTVQGTTPPTRATTLTDSTAEVTDVRFSHDRKTVAVTLAGGTVELWNLGDLPAIAADPTGAACAITGRGLSREEWKENAPGLPYVSTCPQE